ncbi:General transcription factor IIF subunit 1 [Bagarius yarrelli]|uniref:Transcription initiation factor IIF subunit alpha n=1 Tax=Bagarius yarrelli TaxID=175774 RepID=A0A556VUU1_BAGYA|nr:General transcription factor IIF subunit 1 [Bagarius yarrelli]
MERDLSNRRMYGEEEVPEGAAGSEFGKKQREEARRKKFGIVTREFKVEDQPWILKVNGKAGRRFKGQKKGGVTENASYYIFTQCADGAFEAFPVHAWYNFTPVAKHRTLTAEEAEEEWGRRNKVVNHFSIMLQRRLKEQEHGEEEEEEGEKGAKKKKKKKKKGGQGGDLRIHDLEDDLELSSDNSESSAGEDGESRSKGKKENTSKGKGKKKRKKKGSDVEGHEDSDDGDFEGLEVDYMSDQSSSEEDEPEKMKPNKGEEVPKGIDEASESEEESEEENKNEEENEEENEEKEGEKTPVQVEKKKKKGERLKMESVSQSPSGKSTPQPASGKSTPSSSDVQLTEEAVRRYLIRKPMTTKDLLKKFQTKRTGLSSEQTVNVLAQILKKLNPERKNINDKMHFYLTE